ncbi:MAG: hypothetical protein ACI3VP_01320 [Oscillospiraceae bacterium]
MFAGKTALSAGQPVCAAAAAGGYLPGKSGAERFHAARLAALPGFFFRRSNEMKNNLLTNENKKVSLEIANKL